MSEPTFYVFPVHCRLGAKPLRVLKVVQRDAEGAIRTARERYVLDLGLPRWRAKEVKAYVPLGSEPEPLQPTP